MYVKTDFVPNEWRHRFTFGKLYKLKKYNDHDIDFLAYIEGDNGADTLIAPGGCAFLDGRPWTIVKERPLINPKNLIDHTTWREIEEAHGGSFVRLGDLSDAQKDRITVEALKNGAPVVFEDSELCRLYDSGPIEGKMDFLKSATYIYLESDLQDEYDAYKEACHDDQ